MEMKTKKKLNVYAYDTSFERARRAESNDNNIDKLKQNLTNL